MNEHVANWVWHFSKLKDSQDLLVLLALAKHTNGLGEATMKLAELAKLCRITEADAKQSLRSAINAKELLIYPNTDSKGTRLTNTYRFIGFAGPRKNGDDAEWGDIPLPGIPVPETKPPPPDTRPQLMMDAAMLEAIASDPLYKGLNVKQECWKFRRWCAAQIPPAAETVLRFKKWLARV